MRTTRRIALITVSVLVVAAASQVTGEDKVQPPQDLRQTATQLEATPVTEGQPGDAAQDAATIPLADREAATPVTAATTNFVIPWSSVNSGGQPSRIPATVVHLMRSVVNP